MAVKFASLLLMLLLQGGVSDDSIFGFGGPGSGRIINGENVDAGQYPWFARAIGDSSGEWWGCGGSLVTPEFVLTAAHCAFKNSGGFQIGALCESFESDDNCDQKIEQIMNKKVYNHPDYNPSTNKHDIALVRLKGQSTISAVPMDQGSTSTGYEKGKELFAIGLGNTNPNQSGYYPDHLMDVAVGFIPRAECDDIYPPAIDSTMLCAASEGKDSCQGDSGGPLYDVKNDKLVGITSWGYGCASDPFPGVYSNIANQWDWIRETICKDHSPTNKPAFCEGITSSPTDSPVAEPSSMPTDSPAPTAEVTLAPTFSDDCASDEVFVVLSLKTDQYAFETSWSLTNGNNGATVGSESYNTDDSIKQFNYKFCIPKDTCFTFEIKDSYGDGMLNADGAFYELDADGTTVASTLDNDGGDFNYGESATFNCPDSCGSGTSEVSIEIQMDGYPNEISWELTNLVTNSLVASSPGYDFDDVDETFAYKYCISEDTCYEFEINDSFGDGLSFGYTPGSYEISLDGNVVSSGSDFGFQDKVKLACPDEECEDAVGPGEKVEVTIDGVGTYNKKCQWYLNNEYCDYDEVTDVCKKTCDACDDEGDTPSAAPTCGEDFNGKFEVNIPDEGVVKKKCSGFESKGYCQYEEVATKCPESCGCVDGSPTVAPVCEEPSGKVELFVNGKDRKWKCSKYFEKGYCQYDNVAEACPVSCGTCGDSPTTAPCEVLDANKMVVDKEPFDELCSFLVAKDMCGIESVSGACSYACGRP